MRRRRLFFLPSFLPFRLLLYRALDFVRVAGVLLISNTLVFLDCHIIIRPMGVLPKKVLFWWFTKFSRSLNFLKLSSNSIFLTFIIKVLRRCIIYFLIKWTYKKTTYSKKVCSLKKNPTSTSNSRWSYIRLESIGIHENHYINKITIGYAKFKILKNSSE